MQKQPPYTSDHRKQGLIDSIRGDKNTARRFYSLITIIVMVVAGYVPTAHSPWRVQYPNQSNHIRWR